MAAAVLSVLGGFDPKRCSVSAPSQRLSASVYPPKLKQDKLEKVAFEGMLPA